MGQVGESGKLRKFSGTPFMDDGERSTLPVCNSSRSQNTNGTALQIIPIFMPNNKWADLVYASIFWAEFSHFKKREVFKGGKINEADFSVGWLMWAVVRNCCGARKFSHYL
jgi:hypothetical protein